MISKKKLKQTAESLKELVDNLIDDKISLPQNALVTAPESTLSIMTRKRLELIKTINSAHPNSVQELATLTNRSKQAVTRDLKILERFEVIRLEKEGRNVFPLVIRDVIVVSLSNPSPLPKVLPAKVFVDNVCINKLLAGVSP